MNDELMLEAELNVLEAELTLASMKANPYHDPKDGKFAPKAGGKKYSMATGGGAGGQGQPPASSPKPSDSSGQVVTADVHKKMMGTIGDWSRDRQDKAAKVADDLFASNTASKLPQATRVSLARTMEQGGTAGWSLVGSQHEDALRKKAGKNWEAKLTVEEKVSLADFVNSKWLAKKNLSKEGHYDEAEGMYHDWVNSHKKEFAQKYPTLGHIMELEGM